MSIPLILVDGNWLMLRNFYSQDKPQDVGKIVISFLSSLGKIIKQDSYQSEVRVLFDAGTWRYRPKTVFKEYKAGREYDGSHDIVFEVMRDLCKKLPLLGINAHSFPGVEADDIWHYFAQSVDRESLGYTRDRDWYISIGPKSSVYHYDDKLMTKDRLLSDYEIENEHDYLFLKAISGDESDNIPSALDKGEKAHVLLDQWKTGKLSDSKLFRIRANVEVMKLDHILNDNEVIRELNKQEQKLSIPKSFCKTVDELFECRSPSYFYGVFGRYNRVITTRILNNE